MGTIVERTRADGSTAYLAQISISKDGKRVHSEAQTFDRRPAAAAWVKRREKELKENPELVGRDAKSRDPYLRDVIDLYVNDSRKAIGKTKAQVLAAIKGFEIADMRASKIRSSHIIDLARELSAGRQPATVANYLSHLAAIFAIARPAWDVPLDEQAMKDAFKVAQRLGLTGKSRERNRRPTLDELDRIMKHYQTSEARYPGRVTPMTRVVAFALFSTRRQEEITRLRWADFDEAGKRVLVRDMKHPGEKAGNDTWTDLPDEAVAIIKAMPRKADEIFPFDASSISTSFTRACLALGINTEKMPDADRLHFHDLRHEGVSRLFEMGWSIPRAAGVSGHRSWTTLKRYSHLAQVGDKYAGWPWIQHVTAKGGLRLVG